MRKRIYWIFAGVVLCVVALILWDLLSFKQAEADKAKNISAESVVVATVNGEPIYEYEILSEMRAGSPGSRNDVIQAYVNRVIAAQNSEGKNLEALLYARRQVLSSIYLDQATKNIASKVSDADIQEWYGRNITDERFNRYQVSYYLTQDEKDAEEKLSAFQHGKSLDKLKLVGKGDRSSWPLADDLPYETGRIVSTMVKGEIVSRPLMVTNGYLILMLVDIENGKKPDIKDIKDQIRAAIVKRRFADLISEKRKAANVRITE